MAQTARRQVAGDVMEFSCTGEPGSASLRAGSYGVARSCAAREKRERSEREAREKRERSESAMSPSSATRCTGCHQGELTPTRLTVTLTYEGKSVSIDDVDALVCNASGAKQIGERAAALLLTQRALAPDVAMTATVRRRTESI